MYNLQADLSALTNLKPSILDKLIKLSSVCISDCLYEADLSDAGIVKINIGIGTLSILIAEDNLQYSFQPSYELERLLIDTMETKQSQITHLVKESLENKINSAYKELL